MLKRFTCEIIASTDSKEDLIMDSSVYVDLQVFGYAKCEADFDEAVLDSTEILDRCKLCLVDETKNGELHNTGDFTTRLHDRRMSSNGFSGLTILHMNTKHGADTGYPFSDWDLFNEPFTDFCG